MAKNKKTDKKNETILEVNEVTEETVKAEEEAKAIEEAKAREEASNLRKERIKKSFEKILNDYNINFIAKLLMWSFFAISAIYVNTNILRQGLRGPALKIFIAEDSLKDESRYSVDEIRNVRIELESFDVDVKEADSEDIIIRYSKKYDKKINMGKKDRVLSIEEKNKLFKFIRFESSNNLMIIEIPNNYDGSLEIESKSGLVRIEKYKIRTDLELKTEKTNDEDFYKKFFNI